MRIPEKYSAKRFVILKEDHHFAHQSFATCNNSFNALKFHREDFKLHMRL